MKRVAVAMSGGVDSSVAAALLAQKGHEVIGLTMRVWSPDGAKDDLSPNRCCSLEAAEDARRVAAHLSIPHYVVNCREPFYKEVVLPFANAYRQGRTPNPCILCNTRIKFGLLLRKARSLGAEYIATGHYARLIADNDSKTFGLAKGVDREKDQSYTLYGLNQEQLKRSLFPLGEMSKSQTRQLAHQLGLKVAEKPDSQEICFVGASDYRAFLREHMGLDMKPGPILDLKGKRIGTHKGIPCYTLGQRRGLGLPGPEPKYVVAIDASENALIVGPSQALWQRALLAEAVNWIERPLPLRSLRVEAKIRYSHPESPATLYPREDEKMMVVFDEPQKAVTPGQAIVFYHEGKVLGGGTISGPP